MKKWKIQHLNKKTVPKHEFPALLKEAVDGVGLEVLPKAFEKTGIHPFNPDQVLKKIPNFDQWEDYRAHMCCAVRNVLEKMTTPDKPEKSRGFKMEWGTVATEEIVNNIREEKEKARLEKIEAKKAKKKEREEKLFKCRRGKLNKCMSFFCGRFFLT